MKWCQPVVLKIRRTVECVIAVVFTASALSKAWDPASTLKVLAYQWQLSPSIAVRGVWTLIVLEFAVAVWLLSAEYQRAALTAAGGLLIALCAPLVIQWWRKYGTGCGCGLPGSEAHPMLIVFGRNIPLAVAALTSAGGSVPRHSASGELR